MGDWVDLTMIIFEDGGFQERDHNVHHDGAKGKQAWLDQGSGHRVQRTSQQHKENSQG